MNRDDDDPIVAFEVDVDNKHPPPRTKDEVKARPSASQLRPKAWKPRERTDSTLEALLCIRRETMCEDQLIQVGRRRPGDLDPGHPF